MKSMDPQSRHRKQLHFQSISFPDWMLPGEWKTIEILVQGDVQTTSYVMPTKLHPNVKEYVDFWGNVDPYGPGIEQVWISIHEFQESEYQKFRWSVTTGRHTHTDMSTTHHKTLESAMQQVVNEMVKTTKKFDEINKRKTRMWDSEQIILHDSSFNTVQ